MQGGSKVSAIRLPKPSKSDSLNTGPLRDYLPFTEDPRAPFAGRNIPLTAKSHFRLFRCDEGATGYFSSRNHFAHGRGCKAL